MGLKALKVDYVHEFSCDIDANVKKTIFANCPPKVWYDNLMVRDNTTAPAVDLYVAGPPCQSFSMAGLRKGLKDRRGKVFLGVASYIDAQMPRAFILENVKGLLSHDNGMTVRKVLRVLEMIGDGAYDLHLKLINTLDHGVAQSRPRVYIVGVLKSCKQHDFNFPEELPHVSIENFLDAPKKSPTMQDVPPAKSGTAKRNVVEVLKKLSKEGKNPFKNTYVIDADASTRFRSVMHDRVMCMTRSRAAGHWLTSRGRRMNIREMMALQGMDYDKFKQDVTDRQLGCQIGNAMSQNVIERILTKLLPAAGLVSSKTRLVDRWSKFVRDAIPSQVPANRKRTQSDDEDQSSGRKLRKAA